MKSISLAIVLLLTIAGVSFAGDAPQCPMGSKKHPKACSAAPKEQTCATRHSCCGQCGEPKMVVVYSSKGGSVRATCVSIR